mmetsp:Transcript_8607/g.23609  ORF Transcript_8607/g.23609 Transcript_8607/m.23609 type:complete len:302 (-) Transcript_8607:485-1390(-)
MLSRHRVIAVAVAVAACTHLASASSMAQQRASDEHHTAPLARTGTLPQQPRPLFGPGRRMTAYAPAGSLYNPVSEVVHFHSQRLGDASTHSASLWDCPFCLGVARTVRDVAAACTALTALVRYTAYLSDVGEAFRPIVRPGVVTASYAVAVAYVLAVVARAAFAEARKPQPHVALAASHEAAFQGLASLALPALLIHQTVHASQGIFARLRICERWGPTIAGLAVVPFLPVLLDAPVERCVDWAFQGGERGSQPGWQQGGARCAATGDWTRSRRTLPVHGMRGVVLRRPICADAGRDRPTG